MLKECMKTEIRKALFNRKTLIATGIVMALATWQIENTAINYHGMYTSYLSGDIQGNPMITSMSLFAHWMGADVASFLTSLFFFLLPVFAALPYGWSLAEEMKSAYIKNIIMRTTRKNYFISKYAAGFISGVCLAVIPLVYNFLTLALFLPALQMESIYPYGTIGQRCMWSELYYEQPFLYCMLYIMLDGLFAGLFASVATAFAFVEKKRIVVVLTPFFLMLLMDFADTNFFPGGEYSPIKFLQALPVANDCYGWAVFLIGMILFIFTFAVVVYKGTKYEVL